MKYMSRRQDNLRTRLSHYQGQFITFAAEN